VLEAPVFSVLNCNLSTLVELEVGWRTKVIGDPRARCDAAPPIWFLFFARHKSFRRFTRTRWRIQLNLDKKRLKAVKDTIC